MKSTFHSCTINRIFIEFMNGFYLPDDVINQIPISKEETFTSPAFYVGCFVQLFLLVRYCWDTKHA